MGLSGFRPMYWRPEWIYLAIFAQQQRVVGPAFHPNVGFLRSLTAMKRRLLRSSERAFLTGGSGWVSETPDKQGRRDK